MTPEPSERVTITRSEVLVSTEKLAVSLLGKRLRQHRDLGAHGMGDFYQV